MARLRPWVPVVVWALVIFSFSTDTFSSAHTAPYFERVLRIFLPHASDYTIELLHAVFRKFGHVFEYFVFGVLLFRAFRASGRGLPVRWALNALIVAAAFAASDEFHQTFVPSRGASIIDVLLDTCAAALAIFCAWLVARRYDGSRRSEMPGHVVNRAG